MTTVSAPCRLCGGTSTQADHGALPEWYRMDCSAGHAYLVSGPAQFRIEQRWREGQSHILAYLSSRVADQATLGLATWIDVDRAGGFTLFIAPRGHTPTDLQR